MEPCPQVYGETLDFADDAFLTFVGSVGASFNFFSRPFFGRLADYSHKVRGPVPGYWWNFSCPCAE